MLGLTHDMRGYIRVKVYLISSLLQLNRSHSIGPRDMSKYMTLLLSSVLLIMTMSLPFTYGDATSVIPSNETYSPTFDCGNVFIIDHPFRPQNQQLEHWTGESDFFVLYRNRTLHLFNHWVRINQLH